MNGDLEMRLDSLRVSGFVDVADGLAELAVATAMINKELENSSGQITAGAFDGDAIRERLRRWIEKLREIAEAVARQFDALSYSVSVSLPGGVSAGISWSGPEGYQKGYQ